MACDRAAKYSAKALSRSSIRPPTRPVRATHDGERRAGCTAGRIIHAMTGAAGTTAQQRLLGLLRPGTDATARDGYLDTLGSAPQAGPVTGVTQRLMRTSALPLVYERYWRPVFGRVAKGLSGPTMAEEHSYARHKLALRGGDVVLDAACGTGGFTRGFGDVVGQEGLAIGLDASRPMLER